MSFQVGSYCYGTALAAANASASSQVGAVVQLGNKTYVVDVSAVSASSITYILRDVATTAVIVKTAGYTPVPCGLLDYSDGLALGWGVAVVWLVTAGVLFIRRGLHNVT